HAANLGVVENLDVSGQPYTVGQVTGHAPIQVTVAQQEPHTARVLGEKHRRLAGGVPSTHHHDFLPSARDELHGSGGVKHSYAVELLPPRNVQLPIVCARGNEDRSRSDRLPV